MAKKTWSYISFYDRFKIYGINIKDNFFVICFYIT